jgi:4-diphosphocytidyl-2-C-methyl-D-erythritol kinase
LTDVQREKAWAKINLYLHVTGRRPDGYHLIDSLFVFAGVHDVVEGSLSKTLTVEVSGPGAKALGGGETLVHRAAEMLRAKTGITLGAELRLIKNLPVAAGLGGGSADAAATLRLLNRLWGTEVPDRELCTLGAALGADVPPCVISQPLRVAGIGETLAPIGRLPDLYMVLVNPGVPVPTASVFAHLREEGMAFSSPAPTPRLDGAEEFLEDLHACGNDLEGAAVTLAPEIGEALNALRGQAGCDLARMSGSGATCFGLFRKETDAQAAAKALSEGDQKWTWVGLISR